MDDTSPGTTRPGTRLPPVLLCVFNRPEFTARMIDLLQKSGVTDLYVAADGPRPGNQRDVERCAEVRRLVDTIDWPCRVTTWFRPTNFGLQASMVTAIDWFFSHVEAGVILEDDCFPATEWFRFAGELLDRYSDTPQVMHISALNMRDEPFSECSYHLAEVGHIWGWATWRRAWNRFDADLDGWPQLRREWDRGSTPLQRALARKFASAHAGRKATWSRSWYFTMARHRGLAIIPSVNLVENTGDGIDSTHGPTSGHPLRRPVTRGLEFPLQHPSALVPDRRYERYLARYHARSYAQRAAERAEILLAAIGIRRRATAPDFRPPWVLPPDPPPERAEPDASGSSGGARE